MFYFNLLLNQSFFIVDLSRILRKSTNEPNQYRATTYKQTLLTFINRLKNIKNKRLKNRCPFYFQIEKECYQIRVLIVSQNVIKNDFNNSYKSRIVKANINIVYG